MIYYINKIMILCLVPICNNSFRPIFWTNFNIHLIAWKKPNFKHLHLTTWICYYLLTKILYHDCEVLKSEILYYFSCPHNFIFFIVLWIFMRCFLRFWTISSFSSCRSSHMQFSCSKDYLATMPVIVIVVWCGRNHLFLSYLFFLWNFNTLILVPFWWETTWAVTWAPLI